MSTFSSSTPILELFYEMARYPEPLEAFGQLRGRGDLMIASGAQSLGPVIYEIDGYCRHGMRSDSGQIEGSAAMLAVAFRGGAVHIVFADGQRADVTLSDPRGRSTAEIVVSGHFPKFGKAL